MCIRDRHGIANALLLTEVIKFNADENPRKMGTFSQYQYPHTQARYAECARFCGIQAKDDAEAVEKLIAKLEELKTVSYTHLARSMPHWYAMSWRMLWRFPPEKSR